jgi:hypothetical protein
VNANASALENLMALPPTDATTDMNHWLQFSTSDSAFSQIVAGVKSQSVEQELTLKGPLTLGQSRHLDGIEVDAIRGTQAAPGTKPVHAILYVRASGKPLIVEEDTVDAQGKPNGDERIVFSKWGERIRPKAPHASITIGNVSST